MASSQVADEGHAVLLWSVTFHAVLLCSVPFHAILLCSVPFHAVLLCSIPFHAVLLCSVPFHIVLLWSIPFHAVLLWFIPFHSQPQLHLSIPCILMSPLHFHTQKVRNVLARLPSLPLHVGSLHSKKQSQKASTESCLLVPLLCPVSLTNFSLKALLPGSVCPPRPHHLRIHSCWQGPRVTVPPGQLPSTVITIDYLLPSLFP